jgi:hypothetical protein
MRWRWALGILGVALAGSAVGVAAQQSETEPAVEMRFLHVAPVLSRPGVPVELAVAPLCDPSDSIECQVTRALAHVRDASGTWKSFAGGRTQGAFRWLVPRELVTSDGFAYALELRTATGRTYAYPASGKAAPFTVGSTDGFLESPIASLDWQDVLEPDDLVLDLRFGAAPGEVGLESGEGDQGRLTASSFAIGPAGEILVADWVNERVQEFSAAGVFRRSIRTPVRRTLDLEAGRDTLSMLGLGSDGVAYRVSRSNGRVLERSNVLSGVATRIDGGNVVVGPGQAFRAFAPGNASTAGSPSFEAELSQDLSESAFAVRWEGAEEPTGAIVTLPPGFRVGPDYFVQPLADGGAVVTRGIWDDAHAAVGVFTFDPAGRLTTVELLPEPSALMDAVFSTVRWRAGSVLVAVDRRHGLRIESFEVV